MNNQLYKTKFFTYSLNQDLPEADAMTETTQTLRDDIAFMRALADEGVRPPLLAGPSMMTAGVLWGVACFASWTGLRFFGLGGSWQAATMIAPIVLFLAALPFLIRRQRSRPGYKSPANRAVGMAWSGACWGIFVLSACSFVACWRMQSGLPAQLMPSEILVLYGVAWTVSAAMTRDRFLWWTAIASYGSAIVVAAVSGQPEEFLAFSIVMVLVALIPGYILWRQEAKDIV
jgi:hypothetical protein